MSLNNEVKKKNLFTCWFFINVIVNLLFKVLGVGIKKVSVVSGFHIAIEVIYKNVYPILFFLKKHTLSQFKLLVDIICYDTPFKNGRFSLIYNCLSVHYNLRIRIITKIDGLTNIFSTTGIYKSANWSEREIFDFFGIFFIIHKDLRRILTDYGFNGFPLRKDFPMSGYVDIYYDDSQKCICYRNLELAQEYRNFHIKTRWV
jgi:NADH:ubiquinone oxidoreductase subunit C